MTTGKRVTIMSVRSFFGVALLLGGGAVGCEKADPCDPDQVYDTSVCYDAPEEMEPAMMEERAMQEELADAGLMTLSNSDGQDTPFGASCTDDVGSSDCGGTAPFCVPQIFKCSILNCQDGEENAGLCTAEGWNCMVLQANTPSLCFSPVLLQ